MLRIKKNGIIGFGIIVLGVILLGMPAAVYAQDETPMPEPAADEANFEEDNFDSDSSDDIFALGSTTKDFVFTPVKPCRIIDTRNAGGPIASGSTRSFYVRGANLSSQGGNAAGCDSPVGEPLAVVMNIVAVNSTVPGWLTVWPYGETRPLAGILNYNPTDKTDPISNAFTVKTSGAGLDISVYAHGQTHVVADVMGYFSAPEATALQISVVQNTGSVPSFGNFSLQSPYCPSGYVVTGGGCHFFYYNPLHNIIGTRKFTAQSWLCDFTNGTSSSAGVEVHAICARVPGR
jgi:hypothetical protein